MVMENLTHILVFATSIKTEADKVRIGELLNRTPEIEEWSVDCDDIDCVLRVVSYTMTTNQVIELVSGLGFQCNELD